MYKTSFKENNIQYINQLTYNTVVLFKGCKYITPYEYYFKGHYKIFCVNGNTGFRKESRIFYFIHLQNEEDYEGKESSSA